MNEIVSLAGFCTGFLVSYTSGYDNSICVSEFLAEAYLLIQNVSSKVLFELGQVMILYSTWFVVQLCEVDLSDILPSEAFSPFAEEIRSRQLRRQHRMQRVVPFVCPVSVATQLV